MSIIDDYAYQPDLIDSQMYFLLLGLMPGSLGESLLLQDMNMSVARAHPHLKKTNKDGEYFIIRDMMKLTELFIPKIIRTDIDTLYRWARHGGLSGADQETRSLVLDLLIEDEYVDEMIERVLPNIY